MRYAIFAGFVGIALFVAMLVLMELGRRISLRRKTNDVGSATGGTGAIDGAVFALLGLLVAFTFSGAAARFDERRHLIVEETNAIGTAYLRVDVLPAAARPALKDLFRRYVDARIDTYRAFSEIDAARAETARYTALQGEIWSYAVTETRREGVPTTAAILLLPALNQMIDITTTRAMATRLHPPMVIFGMLVGIALLASVLAGYAMADSRRSYIHMIGFAAATATAVYVISDLEYPRLGLLRVESFDSALVDLRRGMN